MKNNRLLYLLIIILAIWLSFATNEIARLRKNDVREVVNEYNITGFSTDFTKIIEEVKPSIVTIEADDSLLSGFVYRQDADKVYVISAYHGVAESQNIIVHFGNSYSVAGQMIGHDIFTDLAVIRIETPYEIAALKLQDTDLLKQGEFLISIGSALSPEYGDSVRLGMVAANELMIDNSISVNDERYSYFLNVVEVSTMIQAGFSGSPLINMNGEVVGMNTMSYSSGSGFALTSNEIRKLADLLISNDAYQRKNLGFKGTFIRRMYNYEKANLNLDVENISGIYVERVKENSLAFNAGIRSGDIITSIDSIVINDLNSYLNALYDDDETTVFEFIRNNESLSSSIGND